VLGNLDLVKLPRYLGTPEEPREVGRAHRSNVTVLHHLPLIEPSRSQRPSMDFLRMTHWNVIPALRANVHQ